MSKNNRIAHVLVSYAQADKPPYLFDFILEHKHMTPVLPQSMSVDFEVACKSTLSLCKVSQIRCLCKQLLLYVCVWHTVLRLLAFVVSFHSGEAKTHCTQGSIQPNKGRSIVFICSATVPGLIIFLNLYIRLVRLVQLVFYKCFKLHCGKKKLVKKFYCVLSAASL